VRALALLIVAGALATPAPARSLEIVGYAGYLGEWELTATVTPTDSGRAKEFSGPLTLTHVGMCAQDGPDEKAGEMRLRISRLSSRLRATLLVEGVECTYRGRLSHSYAGMMECPDRRAVPLTLWVK
jgi:hypothetical protein